MEKKLRATCSGLSITVTATVDAQAIKKYKIETVGDICETPKPAEWKEGFLQDMRDAFETALQKAIAEPTEEAESCTPK